jgi:phosphate ABC transporter, permease protein PstA/phosphate ABC transporter, permease protein PstC
METLAGAERFKRRSQAVTDLLENLIHLILLFLASVPLLITLTLIGIFVYEAFSFFQNVAVELTPDFQVVSRGFWAGVVKFFSDSTWTVGQFEPEDEVFGAGIFVLLVSTLIVSGIAMLVAIPLGVLSAIYLGEYAPPWLRLLLKPALESISGVPTVIWGYFGFLSITPLLQRFFPEIAAQSGLCAGLVIGIFLTPTISSLAEDALHAVPMALQESGYAVGMTKFEVVWGIVVQTALPGIIAAIALAASRTFGETMIALLAGGRGGTTINFNPLEANTTITAFIVGSTDGDLNPGSFLRSAAFTMGMVLFLITLILNSFGNWLILKNREILNSSLVAKADVVATDQEIESVQADSPKHNELPQAAIEDYQFSSAYTLRTLLGSIFYGVALLATLVGVVLLGVVVYQNVVTGLPYLDWQFLTSYQSTNPDQAGIIVPLAGTFVITTLTALLVIPIGIGGAIYLEEYMPDGWWKRVMDVQIANLAAVPSIIYGLLGLGLFVRLQQVIANDNQVGRNILSAALTLTLIVLPFQIIATRSALDSIPNTQRYAAYAVGMTRWQVVWKVLLPAAAPAIATGTLLALTTAIAETAALIAVGAVAAIAFTPTGLDSQFITLPIQIYYWSAAGESFEPVNSAAIITLISILLIINFSAVSIRNLFRLKPR